jgi:hypothetical protein
VLDNRRAKVIEIPLTPTLTLKHHVCTMSESRSHQDDNASNGPTCLIMGLCLLEQKVVRVNIANIWIYYQYCLVEDVFSKYLPTCHTEVCMCVVHHQQHHKQRRKDKGKNSASGREVCPQKNSYRILVDVGGGGSCSTSGTL